MDNKEKILRVLHENPKGLGYNQLKRKVYEKSLRRWLPELEIDGMIKIRKVKMRGGIRKLHLLTDKGKQLVKVMRLNAGIQEKFYKVCGVRSVNERLDLYSKILEDVFDFCLENPESVEVDNFGYIDRFVAVTMTAQKNVIDRKRKYWEELLRDKEIKRFED